MLFWLALVIAALTALLAVFGSGATALDPGASWQIAAGVLATLGLLYAATLRSGWTETAFPMARIGAGAGLLAALGGLGYWLMPPTLLQTEIALPFAVSDSAREAPSARGTPAAVRLRRTDDGRFVAAASINGAAMDLRIDTGAAAIVLKASDAERAGANLAGLSFNTAIATANGTTYVAPLRLRTLRIGAIAVDDIEAFVAKPGSLNENLLGQSFLRRLASYDLTGEFLTLRQ